MMPPVTNREDPLDGVGDHDRVQPAHNDVDSAQQGDRIDEDPKRNIRKEKLQGYTARE
jgi:hypothetical protein